MDGWLKNQLPKGTGRSFDNIKSRIGVTVGIKFRKSFLRKIMVSLCVISNTTKLDTWSFIYMIPVIRTFSRGYISLQKITKE